MKYWVLIVAVAVLASCEPPRNSSDGAAAQYHYSPFVVHVPQSQMVFDRITFKDVGLTRDSTGADHLLLETIAESISYELQITPELGVLQSRVDYMAEYTDPTNHQACENHHLYVDLWNRASDWGYSLWSGCGESDNFAWEEVPASATEEEDLAERVAPMSSAIAAKLVNAHEQQCFVKKC